MLRRRLEMLRAERLRDVKVELREVEAVGKIRSETVRARELEDVADAEEDDMG